MSDTRFDDQAETLGSKVDEGAFKGLRVSNGASVACQKGPDRVSNEGFRVSSGTDRVSPGMTRKSYSEVLEVSKLPSSEEGAVASDSTAVGVRLKSEAKDPETERKATEQRIRKLLEDKECSEWSDAEIARVGKASLEEVRAARAGVTKGSIFSTQQAGGSP